ncbi:MAG: 3-isopropylmalate dehydrogenase [Caulobacterales bacterium]|nr:3-isopropylmalate dehydrogenase [Caulobacterales bacterium]
MTKTLLLLPGDGIGPEVISQTIRIIDELRKHGLKLNVETALFGGSCIDETGNPIEEETIKRAKEVQAVLMGAVGGPKWANVARDKRPEAGLLRLRKEMDVFANLRPAICFKALADASSLKREKVEGLDILFVRELCGGVYFGQPKGIDTLEDGSKIGYDNAIYSTSEIERVTHTAFELAKKRNGRVSSLEKSNVMDSGLLWKQVVTEVHKNYYSDMTLEHVLADNAAMQLARDPKQFDVLLTDNLFGDILSDLAAAITGSIGLLPSAALGKKGTAGLYEPIHGSAPDIAGKGLANPIAAILSFEMALRYSLEEEDLADKLMLAVKNALENGARTKDLGGDLSTAQMGDAIIAML